MKNERSYLRLWHAVMLLAIGLSFITPKGMPVRAQVENNSKSTKLSNPSELEKFWDGFFSAEMEAFGVYGALIVMVDEDEILFARGYGYDDAAQETVIDPKGTILRAGSIAKSVTATAVLQLAEQGKLDMDADVNDYPDPVQSAGYFP